MSTSGPFFLMLPSLATPGPPLPLDFGVVLTDFDDAVRAADCKDHSKHILTLTSEHLPVGCI